MEKRLLIAFVITLGFLMFWSRFMPQQRAQLVGTQRDAVNIEQRELPNQPTNPKKIGTEIGEISDPAALSTIQIEDFIITYSSTGGYIKSLAIGEKDNELPFTNIGFVAEDATKNFVAQVSRGSLEFRGPGGKTKKFKFEGDVLTVRFGTSPLSPIVIFSNILSPNMLDQRYQEIFYSKESVVKRIGAKKTKNSQYQNIEFAGVRDRYYCLSLVKGDYSLELVRDQNITHLYLEPTKEFQLYIGPQIEKRLKPYGLSGITYYGFFHILGVGMIKLLYFLYSLTKNWGLSIIGFSIVIYFALFPFTSKSTKAMQKMQQIQPEIEELKEKYKENPQKLQKETIELYRKYRINPLGGCLPLLFQFPIFIALYQVLFRFVELKGASFLWIKDLSVPDHLFKLPFGKPLDYFNLLPILIVCLGLFQQKITTSGSSTGSQQKAMGLFFAVFLGVIFYNFPSALVLYWFMQNILTISYQFRIRQPKTT